jgi:hypothetical protein
MLPRSGTADILLDGSIIPVDRVVRHWLLRHCAGFRLANVSLLAPLMDLESTERCGVLCERVTD